jgi:2',3'-cyclic-nucleotide 2'-phosphodiesterase (5'-nucleotidase family)
MRFSRQAILASILVVLAFPVGLAAQSGHQLTILQTTDLHDHANGADHVGLDVDVNGTGNTGAYARIAAYVNYVRATAHHPVVLVDSGDWTMGTLYDLTLGDLPLALLFLDLMDYDCVTLGNHEFDYTPRGLAQIFRAARMTFGFHTPVVASNMNLGGNSDLAPFVGTGNLIDTIRVQRFNAIKVGYIGLMGEAAAIDAPASAPVSFSRLSTHYADIQNLVDTLRGANGVDVVIALSHSGTDATGTKGEDVELARHVRGIDVIASGHTHTPLASAHAVTNGTWTTQIIDAGAFGTNVARIDLTFHPSTKTTTVNAFSNVPMTDAGLAAVNPGLVADPVMARIVRFTDQQLNLNLGPFFSLTFPDYSSPNIGTGIYHPVASAAQDMVSNGANAVPSPNGLGDLAADAVRNVPNSIIASTLKAVGGNPANLPGYDFTPFQVGAVATGILRGKLHSGVPISFADVYNVLPLGISPDSSQSLPIGYPMISLYLDLADLKKACALQLVAQSGLVASDFYLNLSGIQYSLNSDAAYAYFKSATAAAVLQVTSDKATAGSAAAIQAITALAGLGRDSGAALLGAYAAGNPYAAAMVKLNDSAPTNAQIATNLGALGEVAIAAATGHAASLIVSKAVAAIDTVSGFAPGDLENTGTATALNGATRVRAVVDLYAVLLLGAVQSQYGIAITPYAAATGPTPLAGAAILANRIDAAPATAGTQELKEWMALLSYVATGLGGSISSDYASTTNFTQFGTFGVAVRTRDANYPIANIGQLISTLVGLQAAP